MKKTLYKLTFLIFIAIACQNQISPVLPEAKALIGIDAWVYRKAEPQDIFIYTTNTYFDNSRPTGVEGASVSVVNISGNASDIYPFVDKGKGIYEWTPQHPLDTFGIMGDSYELKVEINNKKYTATSTINRVPKVDSITIRKDNEEDEFNTYIADFWAKDIKGEGDVYWIKTWHTINNFEPYYLNSPVEINIAYDGAFSKNGGSDGETYILPIREAINPSKNLYLIGDSIYVEINSLTEEAFFFLQQVATQTTREGGFGELFSIPLANIQSNIFSNDPKEKVVGFFCTSASKGLGKTLKNSDIRE